MKDVADLSDGFVTRGIEAEPKRRLKQREAAFLLKSGPPWSMGIEPMICPQKVVLLNFDLRSICFPSSKRPAELFGVAQTGAVAWSFLEMEDDLKFLKH